MNGKIDYQKVLDNYGIKYRKGSEEEVDAAIRNMDMIFERAFSDAMDVKTFQTTYEMNSKEGNYKTVPMLLIMRGIWKRGTGKGTAIPSLRSDTQTDKYKTH